MSKRSDFMNYVNISKQVAKGVHKSEEKKAIKWLKNKQKDYSQNGEDLHYEKIIYNLLKEDDKK